MPYLNEQKKDNGLPVSVDWKFQVPGQPMSDATLISSITAMKSESQYGFRSRPMDDLEVDIPKGSTWGEVRAHLTDESRMEAATTPDPRVRQRSAPVNDRKYYRISTTYSINRHPMVTGSWDKGTWEPVAVGGWAPGNLPSLSGNVVISDQQVNDLGHSLDKLMRARRPTAPAFGLTRALIELRDFPRLVTHLTDILTLKSRGFNPGRGWLSYQFGAAPVAGDIAKAASAVLSVSEKLRQFASNSGKLQSRVVEQQISSVESTVPYWNTKFVVDGNRVGGFASWVTIDDGSVVTTVTAKSFGLYEYFVGDPGRLLSKSKEYELKAQQLLGIKLTPQVVWQVTPWSWLVDWFADIQGLLGYQQDVADYSLALRRAGYSVFAQSSMHVTGKIWHSGPTSFYVPVSGIATAFRHVRVPAMSPYGLMTGWNELSSFQLSILAALGLSKIGRR